MLKKNLKTCLISQIDNAEVPKTRPIRRKNRLCWLYFVTAGSKLSHCNCCSTLLLLVVIKKKCNMYNYYSKKTCELLFEILSAEARRTPKMSSRFRSFFPPCC